MEDKGFDLIDYLTVRKNEGTIIWLCNIGAERFWNSASTGVKDVKEDVLVNRMEEMNLLLCRKQDILILREAPDPCYLEVLEKFGFSIPQILVPTNSDELTPISMLVLKDELLLSQLREIGGNGDIYFLPYAVTELEEKIAMICGLHMIGAPSNISASVNNKLNNRRIADEIGLATLKGYICKTPQEIIEAYDTLTQGENCYEKVIIKEPTGASGKGLHLIDRKGKLDYTLRMLTRFSKSKLEDGCLVEGWYKKKADLNCQIYISEKGDVRVFSIKQQILDNTVYMGSKMPPDIEDEYLCEYSKIYEKIGSYLFNLGYTGVAGIDSIIDEKGVFIPIVEINGRFTLSTYTSFIQSIFGDVKVVCRYFRVFPKMKISYCELIDLLGDKKLLYDDERKEGVVVYTSGTLPYRYLEDGGMYYGRVFMLIISKDWGGVNELDSRIQDLFQAIQ